MNVAVLVGKTKTSYLFQLCRDYFGMYGATLWQQTWQTSHALQFENLSCSSIEQFTGNLMKDHFDIHPSNFYTAQLHWGRMWAWAWRENELWGKFVTHALSLENCIFFFFQRGLNYFDTVHYLHFTIQHLYFCRNRCKLMHEKKHAGKKPKTFQSLFGHRRNQANAKREEQNNIWIMFSSFTFFFLEPNWEADLNNIIGHFIFRWIWACHAPSASFSSRTWRGSSILPASGISRGSSATRNGKPGGSSSCLTKVWQRVQNGRHFTCFNLIYLFFNSHV